MLRRWILSIRHKPKHVRDSYALGVATVTTTLVALVWLYHWPAMIESRQEARRPDVPEVPTTSFLEQAKEQIATARESIDLDSLTESVASTTAVEDVRTIDFGAAFASVPKNSTTTPTNLAATTTIQLPIVATTTTSTAVVQ